MPPHTIFELRDYTLRPGQRDTLIALFEQHFIETQEAAGMRIVGTFRDLDRPDRFVWIRSFTDMPTRKAALEAFYGGPVWQAHRAAANATMLDSDNARLLRAAGAAPHAPARRPPQGAPTAPCGLVVATIHPLSGATDDFATLFQRDIAPELTRCGATVLAAFATDPSPNTYPRLPVRTDGVVFVALLGFGSEQAHATHLAALDASPAWRDHIAPQVARHLSGQPETRRLQPTARSLLRVPPQAGPDLVGRPGDFDFLQGDWLIANRRLRQRHAGCQDWDTFPATGRLWTLLDGAANVDTFDGSARGFKGMTVRTLDRARRRWSIHWVNSTDGLMLPPVRGGFQGDRGEFLGDDMDGDMPILCRFVWTRHAETPRWEQAFSLDGGATWETNWIMDFRRA